MEKYLSKKYIKEIFKIIFTFAFAFIFINTAHAYDVGIYIDDKLISFTENSGAPFIDENSRTQVPLRVTMENFGCTVDWDNINKIASVTLDDITVLVPMNSNFIYINNQIKYIDTKNIVVNNRIYLPIRFVLEAFDAMVQWDNVNKTVIVYSPGYGPNVIEDVKDKKQDEDNEDDEEEDENSQASNKSKTDESEAEQTKIDVSETRYEIIQDDLEDIYINRCVMIKAISLNGKMYSQGSGFFVSEDGYLITNRHVIKNSMFILAEMESGKIYYDVKIVDENLSHDLALLKIEANNTKFDYFDIDLENELKVSDICYSISSPHGEKNLIKSGSIITMAKFYGNDYYVSDLDIKQGSSGGIVIDKYGEASGITTATSTLNNEDVALILPINYVGYLDASKETDEGIIAFDYTYLSSDDNDLDFEEFSRCDLINSETEIDEETNLTSTLYTYNYSDFQAIPKYNVTLMGSRRISVYYYEEALKALGYELISSKGSIYLDSSNSSKYDINDVFEDENTRIEITYIETKNIITIKISKI